ncbi:MAG: iduronate-2-sulfatase [Gemmatales bacterium]|nr:MAG: iduronate-2-sulfatase [Gemmatales bacterium]
MPERRLRWWLVLVASVASLVSASGAEPPARKRPNVLFIAVDDLRPHTKAYGVSYAVTPNLDRLARQGMLFERAYCQVPVCGASRSSLLTGLRPTPRRFRTWNARVDRDAPGVMTLPEYFKAHGYECISLGKVFHAPEDTAKAWSKPPWAPKPPYARYLTEEARTIAKRNPTRHPAFRGPVFEAADVDDDKYQDGELAAKAIEELHRLQKGEKPFFLAVGFYKPHLPFLAPKRYWDLYNREKLPLPDNLDRSRNVPKEAFHNSGELVGGMYAPLDKKRLFAPDFVRQMIHGYSACTSYVDAQIGKVIEQLDKLGLRENTIIVVWGDHGWNLGEHRLWCKHCCFETSLRTLLLVDAPGFAAGQKANALVELLDLYPTLCELAGLSLPRHLEGQSFVPLLKNPKAPWKDKALSRYGKADSVVTTRYRYTEWIDPGGKVAARMLYDHRTDPGENKNLADDPAYAEICARLRALLPERRGK